MKLKVKSFLINDFRLRARFGFVVTLCLVFSFIYGMNSLLLKIQSLFYYSDIEIRSFNEIALLINI